MNPDNLATPLAASIGDVVAISLLSFIASLLFQNLGKSMRIFIVFKWELILLLLPVFRNPSLGHVRHHSWLLLLAALLDTHRVPQQIHAQCADQWLDSCAVRALHQRHGRTGVGRGRGQLQGLRRVPADHQRHWRQSGVGAGQQNLNDAAPELVDRHHSAARKDSRAAMEGTL